MWTEIQCKDMVQLGLGMVIEGLSSSCRLHTMPCRRSAPPPQVRQTSLPTSHHLSLQVVLNQKFTDCFVLVFLDSHLGKTVRTGTGTLRQPSGRLYSK